MNRVRHSPVNKWRLFGYAAGILITLTVAAGLTHAGVGYDVTVGLDLGDDTRLFLNVTNEHYGPPEREATALVRRCKHPRDEFPVVLFLAHAAAVPADHVLDLRLRGLSWADVMFRLRVGPDVLFARLDRDPGPPYGKAWGHYKRHRKGARIALSDRDIIGLAKLQIMASHYGVDPHVIISERKRGVSFEKYAAAKHRANKEKARPAKHSKKSSRKGKKH